MRSQHYLANVPTDVVYMYVRRRGRAKGPYGWTQLQKMIATGELNEIHELSLDNNNWKPASIYPVLFDPDTTSTGQNKETGALGISRGQWYFEMDDRAFGPVDFHRLYKWIDNDWLDLPARVWTEGLEDWVEVVSIPSFFPPAIDVPPDTLSDPDMDITT